MVQTEITENNINATLTQGYSSLIPHVTWSAKSVSRETLGSTFIPLPTSFITITSYNQVMYTIY